MARIRTIKPEFPQSESMGRMSREARLLYVNLWTVVDDEGRARGSSRMLASLLYPYDDDAPGLIDGWLTELEGEGCIRRYEVDGSIYIELCNWLKHQKIDKPSKSRLPAFADGSRIVANVREPSATDLGPRTLDLGPSTRTMDRGPAVAVQPSAHAEIIEPSKQRKKRKPDLPLPDDWKLSTELWTYGTSLGLTSSDLDREETNIKLWCREKDHRCVDRAAFVQRWLRRTIEGTPRNSSPRDRQLSDLAGFIPRSS